nr:MAG TPA: hypothetical protein [Caudoviricetes sp.]
MSSVSLLLFRLYTKLKTIRFLILLYLHCYCFSQLLYTLYLLYKFLCNFLPYLPHATHLKRMCKELQVYNRLLSGLSFLIQGIYNFHYKMYLSNNPQVVHFRILHSNMCLSIDCFLPLYLFSVFFLLYL